MQTFSSRGIFVTDDVAQGAATEKSTSPTLLCIGRWALGVGRWAFAFRMFPLNTATFPASADELTRRLNESLRDLFDLPQDPVDLSRRFLSSPGEPDRFARRRPAPRPAAHDSVAAGETTPALSSTVIRQGCGDVRWARLRLTSRSKRKISICIAAYDRRWPHRSLSSQAADGRLEISASPSGIEALIAEWRKPKPAKHGVTIDSVQLSLRSNSPRSLAAEVRLRAKKLFLSASLRITGQLDLDEELNAKISGLACTGEGAIASIACGILKPHLQKIDGREFPLMSLPAGRSSLARCADRRWRQAFRHRGIRLGVT